MTLLAIDPGTTQSGFVVWDNRGLRIVDSGVLSNDEMRLRIHFDTRQQVTQVAIEMIASYGMAVGKEVFQTCLWIGRFMECSETGLPQLIYRKDVKIHLCGTARATDSNIRQALIDKLGVVGTKRCPGPLYGVKSHAWPALAVAVTALGL